MKLTVKLFFACLLCTFMTSAQENEQSIPSILPTPQWLTPKNVRFKIASGTRIVLGSGSSQEMFAAQQINDDFGDRKEAQLKIVTENSLKRLPASYIFIGSPATEFGRQLLRDRKGTVTPMMKDEGYFLDVDASGIVIVGESEAGRFYGVMTLLQILVREKRNIFADGVSISDFPVEKIRGISDDLSRGQVSTLENFKKIIRFLARYKMNTYSPYLEDMFVFKNHPLIGKGRGALTAAEVRNLDSYAKKYHVDMIPTFESLGHWENILAKPEYLSFAEFPGAQTLNVSDEKVYAMLDEMIGELCHAFSSPYFNMAADESWDVGLGFNRDRVAKNGLATVHADHYKRVVEIIRKYGKKPMMYGDIILNNPAILDKISKDIVIVDWHYDPEFSYTSPEVFRKASFQFIACPAVWNFTGPFPDFFGSLVNIRNFNRDAHANGSLGILTSNWNDYGGEELRELNYYGYAWTSECSWNPEHADVSRFNKTFFKDFFLTNDVTKLQSIYAMLSSPANSFSWHELWRHPMLPLRPQSRQDGYLNMTERVESIKSTMPLVLALLEEERGTLGREEDHLRYLTFVAKLNLWFAKKIEAADAVKRLYASAAGVSRHDSAQTAIVDICTDVLKDLASLKNEFERLWLATNESAGLENLLNRYDRQAAYWQEEIDQAKRGLVWTNLELRSQWLYHPHANPGSDTLPQVQRSYFRKTFQTPKGLRSATLQLMADTYAKLLINGKAAGEVYVRRSNSLSIEPQRMKVMDILPLLNDSVNVLAVEAQSFEPGSSAGVNIYCELQTVDGTVQTLMSDSTWKVSDVKAENWFAVSFVDSTWSLASPKPYPLTVVRPNFETGRSSWIER